MVKVVLGGVRARLFSQKKPCAMASNVRASLPSASEQVMHSTTSFQRQRVGIYRKELPYSTSSILYAASKSCLMDDMLAKGRGVSVTGLNRIESETGVRQFASRRAWRAP